MGLTHANFVLLQGSPTWSHSCLEYYPGESVWVLAEVDNALRPQGVRVEPPLQNAGVCYVSNRFVFLCITTFRGGGRRRRRKERREREGRNGLFDQSTVFAESALACFLKRKNPPAALKPNTIPASLLSIRIRSVCRWL